MKLSSTLVAGCNGETNRCRLSITLCKAFVTGVSSSLSSGKKVTRAQLSHRIDCGQIPCHLRTQYIFVRAAWLAREAASS